MNRKIIRTMAYVLGASLLLTTAGCGRKEIAPKDETSPTPTPAQEVKVDKTINLMENLNVDKDSETIELSKEFLAAQNDFAAKLLRTQYESGKNTMVSPLSAMLALAMTANGADGDTLKEMENVLGGGIKIDDLNRYLASYVNSLQESDKCKVNIANSIWFRDDTDVITVRQEFLKTAAKYYNSEIFKAPFDDGTTKDVNNWVNKNTDGMIEKILEKVKKEDVMYLINAIAFDAEWSSVYDEAHVIDDDFTDASGKTEKVKMMLSNEKTYLHDDNTTGFMKPYAGQYAFVALRPNDGISMDDYIKGLTGEKIQKLMKSAGRASVNTMMPAFKTECSFTLNDGLKEMGMPTAFDGVRADFGKMIIPDGNGNVCIDRVIQKTFIEVGEKGTKAGAATLVAMMKNTAIMIEDYREVYLDRPFVYMIVDVENNLPLFMGVECGIEK